MSLLLTREERERFAAWLEHEAGVDKGMIEQMKKLGPHTAPIVLRYEQESAAALIIARKLRSIEDASL